MKNLISFLQLPRDFLAFLSISSSLKSSPQTSHRTRVFLNLSISSSLFSPPVGLKLTRFGVPRGTGTSRAVGAGVKFAYLITSFKYSPHISHRSAMKNVLEIHEKLDIFSPITSRFLGILINILESQVFSTNITSNLSILELINFLQSVLFAGWPQTDSIWRS